MKVLNLQLKHIHGGNPQVCLDYTRVLAAAGNDVMVLTNPADPFLDTHKMSGAIVVAAQRLGELGSYDLFTILYFKKIIKPSDEEKTNHKNFLKNSLKKNFFN